jgi:hypothetical protein
MAQLRFSDALQRDDRDPEGCRRHLFAPRPRRCRHRPGCAEDRRSVDVTLTIDPGVTIFGATGVSYLAVNRGNRSMPSARRRSRSSSPAAATSSARRATRRRSCGAASSCSAVHRSPIALHRARRRAPQLANATPKARRARSMAARQPADNSGRMSYVQIRYSGFILSAALELQGLTPSGVGSGTQLDHIQVHNSSDDGIEVFGGRVNMKHLVITGAEDDGLDTDVGYQGNIQYVIGVQREGGAVGDSMMEIDSNGNEDTTPRQRVAISNFTYIHRNNAAGNGVSILVRGGADYTFANGLIVAPGFRCLGLNSATTINPANPALDEAGPPVFQSVSLQCNATPFRGTSGVTDAQVQTIFEAGTNNRSNYTPSLTSLFINGATETGFTPFNAKTLNAFFDTTAYVGAVRDANDTWYQGWTCNSSTANFGTTSRACSAIPTT